MAQMENTKQDKIHYLLYWLVALIFVIGGILKGTSLYFFASIFFLFGLGNFVFIFFNRKLNSTLTRIHCLGTAVLLSLFSLDLMLFIDPSYTNRGIQSSFFDFWNILLIFCYILQLVYLANILIGILNKR